MSRRLAGGRGLLALPMVLAAALITCAWLTPNAHAQTTLVPEIVEQNIDSVTQFYAKQSGSAQAACDAVCTALTHDLERPPTLPEDPMPPRIIKSMVDKAVRLGSKAPWEWPTSSAGWGVAGGLAVANFYVWKFNVGVLYRAFFVKAPKEIIEDPDPGLQLQFSDATDGGFYIHEPVPDGSLPDPMPLGIVARNHVLARAQTSSCETACGSCVPRNWAGIPKPAGMVEYRWIWGHCGGQPYYSYGWRVPLEQSLGFINGLDSYNSPDTPVTFELNGNILTLQELKDRLQNVLTSDDPEYAAVGQWMCAVLGGACQNPKDRYPTTPDCVGKTPSACEQDFRDAGFVGDITTVPLTADQAIMEQQAGRVTDTYPHRGLQIAAPRDITIYANPSPMPVMTTADDALAATLAVQNPETVDDTNKKTIARTCRARMIDAGRSTSACAELPIMVAGNDQETPAWNGVRGLVRNASWAVLNRRDIRGLSRSGWYNDLAEPAPGCVNAEKPMNNSCDEFPFFSTMQAYGAPLNTLIPSIRWAPKAEQDRQRDVIRQFYSNYNPIPTQNLLFHGCDIARQPPTDVFPLPQSTFIYLPIPPSPAQSTGICNKTFAP